MTILLKPVFVLYLSTILLSCSQPAELSDNSGDVESVATEEQNDMSKLLPIIIEEPPQDHQTDRFTVEALSVDGDILSVTVSYGGGCKDHEWKMYSSNRVAKSYPPKLNIFLEHTANGDMCKALLREELRFDLKDVQYKGSDVIHLQMNNYDEFIVYKY